MFRKETKDEMKVIFGNNKPTNITSTREETNEEVHYLAITTKPAKANNQNYLSKQ